MAESSPLFGFDPATTTVVANYGKVAEAQGDIADAAAKGKSQKAPFDFLGVGKAAVAAGDQFVSQKNSVDAHTARLRAIDFMNKNQHLTGHELSQRIAEEIKGISNGDFSTGYREGALSVLETGYDGALKRKEEERVASSFNVIQSDFSVLLNSYKKNNISISDTFAADYAKQKAAEFRLPIENVRNAMVASFYQEASMRVNVASSPDELKQALTYLSEMRKPLNNPLFLASRADKFSQEITAMQSSLDKQVTAKEKEFKQAAAFFLESAVEGDGQTLDTTYPVNPLLHQDKYVAAFPDNRAGALNKLKEDVKNFNEAESARTYISNFDSKAMRPEAVPSKDVNKYIRPEVVKIVTKDLMASMDSPKDFVLIAQRSQDVIKDAGDNIARIFTSTSDEKLLDQYHTAFNTIANHPGGSHALQLVLGNNYKDIMTTMVLAEGYTNGDVLKARNVLFESQGKLTQGAFTGDDENTLHKYKAKLGARGSDFEAVIQKLRNVNEGLAAQKMEDIYKKFSEGIVEVNGIAIDKSQNDTSALSYTPDLFNNKLAKVLTDVNGGLKPGMITNLAQNKMSVKDAFGFTTDVVDATPLLDVVNKLAAAKATDDTRNVTYWSKIGDHYDLLVGQLSFGVANFPHFGTINERYKKEYKPAVDKIWATPNGVSQPDGKGGFTEGPGITEVAKTVAELNKMYPLTIDPKDVPDYDLRKSIEGKNAQARTLIKQISDELVYGNTNLPIDDEYDPYNIDVNTDIPIAP